MAADVDDGVYNDDDEDALESDDEEEDHALKGLDLEEDSEGESFLSRSPSLSSFVLIHWLRDRTPSHPPSVLVTADRETDEGFRGTSRGTSTRRDCDERC